MPPYSRQAVPPSGLQLCCSLTRRFPAACATRYHEGFSHFVVQGTCLTALASRQAVPPSGLQLCCSLTRRFPAACLTSGDAFLICSGMIHITEQAAKHLRELAQEKGSPGLRLAVEKGGCAGLQYSMSLGGPLQGDEITERDGAMVAVDPESSSHLEGCTIDYTDELTGAGFRIINPRAARSCGCGTSFEPGEKGSN